MQSTAAAAAAAARSCSYLWSLTAPTCQSLLSSTVSAGLLVKQPHYSPQFAAAAGAAVFLHGQHGIAATSGLRLTQLSS